MADDNPRKFRIHPEMLVGLSAVVIGVCALGVSLYETSLMREEQRAAVMPLLELSRSHMLQDAGTSSERYRLWLSAENVGIGPARIADFRVTVDGIPHLTWDLAMRELIGRDAGISYGQSTINGRTIPTGRSVKMMNLNDTELTVRILAEFDRLDFEACYCSIFDECWITSYSDFGAASEVESCPSPENSFLE